MNSYSYLFLFLFLAISLYFVFRRKKIELTLLTDLQKRILATNVKFYATLDMAQRERFEVKIAQFLNSVKIEGVGTDITPLDEILVGASAVIPIFGFDNWEYRNLGTVLLYPTTFNKDFQFEEGSRNILGMVGDGYMNGQMILSQQALRNGFSDQGDVENTGIHEFVHLLDKSDGATDGIPQNFLKHNYTIPWVKMMHQEIQNIETNKSDINPYAITNEAEFFAVVSEYFFENPAKMKENHLELYNTLAKIFGQKL